MKIAVKSFFEFVGAIRRLRISGPCVSFFGSAIIKPGDEFYELARKAASAVAREGFVVMTGGGPGIMEAANRGAQEAGGKSLACSLTLPHEQKQNPYLDSNFTTKYFFVRKVVLVKYSYAFVFLPGGIGTLDEFFEILALIRTGKSPEVPVVLLGREHWKPTIELIEKLIQLGLAEKTDRELFTVTDSIEEMVQYIKAKSVHKLTKRRVLKYEVRGKDEA